MIKLTIEKKTYHTFALTKTFEKLMYVLIIQLFLMLISLPFLTLWNLPLSLISPIGNLLFTPFLILYLSLSSFIFFLELVCIPNTFLIYTLELITQAWKFILNYGDRSWLIYLPSATLVCIPLLAVLIIHYRITYKLQLCLFIALLSCCFYFKHLHTSYNDYPLEFSYRKAHFLITRFNNKHTLYDWGILSTKMASKYWINTTLLPYLLQHNCDTLDSIVLLIPSSKLFESLVTLMKKVTIKKIYILSWCGPLGKQGWKNYRKLLLSTRGNTELNFLRPDSKDMTINSISLLNTGKLITKGNLQFPKIILNRY